MIPSIQIQDNLLYIGTTNRTGSMCNAYSPFKNFSDKNKNLGDFTTDLLDFDLSHPVDIITLDSYDGSVNLVLNDGKNQPRLIGSRFSVVDDKQFKVVDHSGFKDTNIYEENTFDIDTSLKTIAQKIPIIELDKIVEFGGNLPCGAYTFYFKLSDADGNESEIIAESGIVQLFIGGLTEDSAILAVQPESMRMGTENESTGKSVTFKITNIDTGFDYVHVLYARSSSSNDQASTDTYHKIIYDYPITNNEAIITITGEELTIEISAEELYVDYADLQSVDTQAVVNNVLFFGNLNKKEHDWDLLRRASWKIIPSFNLSLNVGSIDRKYAIGGQDIKNVGGYYNPYNVYYRTGYWPDEIYRFGVVYIFEDNSLSPVFNVPGVDFTKIDNIAIENLFKKIKTGDENNYFEYEAEPEDYYFDKTLRINSRGVIKFPKRDNYEVKGGTLYPKPIYINFDLSHITDYYDSDPNNKGFKPKEDWKLFLKNNNIKGLFFVRQKRIPTILGQGLAIGLTSKDTGACPIIKSSDAYTTQSFLSENQLILPEGRYILDASDVSVNALLVPDAELKEETYNQLFVSNSYALIDSYQMSFSGNDKEQYAYYGNNSTAEVISRKLTNVPEDIKTLTDGEMYFSTMAGNPSEAYKTQDVKYIWNKTAPQDLTTSTSLIRGQWGPFVGVGEKSQQDSTDLVYGHIYTIKSEIYSNDEEEATSLDFLKRFNSAETYSAICDRTEILNIDKPIDCYRGDCFISMFTHRMFRNFIDPELPTNDKIISPMCWAQNYGVRCTAIAQGETKFNVLKEDQGWCVETPQEIYANEIVTSFEIKEGDQYSDYTWDTLTQSWKKGDEYLGPNAILGGSNSVSKYLYNGNLISVVKPSEQESGVAGMIKNLFKSSRWALRGLTSINRADVNAVGLGQWITFPICSSINLALRDIDYSNATEQASFNKKRSFYPLSKMDVHNPLRDSNIINQAAAISLPHKHYYAMPNVPFIKLEYFTRVINSLRDSAASITNEFKIMLESAYRDYTKTYGAITKLMPLASKMLVVFEHGLGVLALNDSMSQAQNATQYLPAELSMVVSTTYGSMWKDSVIEASGYIYGVDSVAKVIWRVGSDCQLELISQLKIEKFLIDNLDMSEFTTKPYIGHINIKSHYNAFKHDILFTYYNDILYKFDLNEYGGIALEEFNIDIDGYLLNSDGTRTEYCGEKVVSKYDEESGKIKTISDIIAETKGGNFKWASGRSWSICFNELLGKFITFYDWIPLESENIDNIWFSFDREAANKLVEQGFNDSLIKTIKPKPYKIAIQRMLVGIRPSVGLITDYNTTTPELRDEKYPKHVIDSTFNSSCAINYINRTKLIAFLDIPIVYNQGFANMFGFYLKPGNSYTIKVYNLNNRLINGTNGSVFNLEDSDKWQFIAIRVTNENINNIKIIVVNNPIVTNNSDSKGAVTDIIHKLLPDTFESITSETVYAVPDEYLDSYYSVRDLEASLRLWKHGQAGIYDNEYDIRPTYWYGLQHEFNFEFIARKDSMHKIFNNLLLISNKVEPNKFEFEIVGETYDWHKYKPVLKWIADQVDVPTDNNQYEEKLQYWYKEVLSNDYGTLLSRYSSTFPRIFGMKRGDRFLKLPYLKVTDAVIPTLDPEIIGNKKREKDKYSYKYPEQEEVGQAHNDNTSTTALVYDKQLNEYRVHTEQLANDVRKYGRLRGNMLYLEDLWRIEVRPVSFKWIYLNENSHINNDKNILIEGIDFSKLQETRHRDKYCKIKIRYSGEDLAVIQGISTLFDYSYA